MNDKENERELQTNHDNGKQKRQIRASNIPIPARTVHCYASSVTRIASQIGEARPLISH